MAKPRTWAQKLEGAKPPHNVVLDKAFAGVPPGATLHISSPAALRDVVVAIPLGQTRTVQQLRDDLARANGADATCPVSTAIFLRVVAEAALERLAAGASASEVTPFWRVVEPGSTLARKLSGDPDFITTRRAAERG